VDKDKPKDQNIIEKKQNTITTYEPKQIITEKVTVKAKRTSISYS
jgi:hypothetical protein